MLDADNVVFRLVITLVPLILAIAVHEYAHVAAARFLGDDTGTRLGRFTLNPLAHIDPLWTVGLPALLVVLSAGGASLPFFAAGKPAPYNPHRLTRTFGGKRISQRSAEMWIAAAGPASNIVLAIISGLLLVGFARLGHSLESHSPVWLLVIFFQLNIALAVFNLIPLPPLDGSKVLYALLPTAAADQYMQLASRLSWVMFALVLLYGPRIIGPVVGAARSLLFGLL